MFTSMWSHPCGPGCAVWLGFCLVSSRPQCPLACGHAGAVSPKSDRAVYHPHSESEGADSQHFTLSPLAHILWLRPSDGHARLLIAGQA